MQVGSQKTRPSSVGTTHFRRLSILLEMLEPLFHCCGAQISFKGFYWLISFIHVPASGTNLSSQTLRMSSGMNTPHEISLALKQLIRMTVPARALWRPACHSEAVQYRVRIHYGANSQCYSASNGSGSGGFTPRARLTTSARSHSQPR